MVRLACLLAVVAACGSTTDERPRTVEYLTAAIFAPTCGQAQCHSSFTQSNNVVLDTVDGVRHTAVAYPFAEFNTAGVGSEQARFDVDTPDQAALIQWITQTDPFELGIGRMPFDAPLPHRDVTLLEDWIHLGMPGAGCDPKDHGGLACLNSEIVKCTADWELGEFVRTCDDASLKTVGCYQSACVCAAGYAECNAKTDDGCETHSNVDSTNCGGCGHHCAAPGTNHALGTCASGSCSCDPGFKSCDGIDAATTTSTAAQVGCETDVTTNDNCGSCANKCAAPKTCTMTAAGSYACQ